MSTHSCRCAAAFFVLALAGAPLGNAGPGVAWGQATAPSPPPALDPAVQKSVDAAVAYIASQQHADGVLCDGDQDQTAVTALAVMALKSAGVRLSQQTHEATVLRKAMTWMLQDARLRPDGYFGNDESKWMYTHGITTLMLAQMLHSGADEKQDALIQARLRKAVDLILQAQRNNQAGGWKYLDTSTDADLPATVYHLRALAAARDAGIAVPREAFASAAAFVKNCAADGGGFAYAPGGTATWSSSAAGLLVLQLCGEGDSPEAKAAADYLQAHARPTELGWYLYGCPAYVAAMGAAGPEALEDARSNVADTLLRWQKSDGSFSGWQGDASQGQVYCTSLVVISLTSRPERAKFPSPPRP